LVDFQENVPEMKAGDPYAEFHAGVGVLAIFSSAAQEKYIPGSAESASNRSVILEFQVDDVDHEYVRLPWLVKIWAKETHHSALGYPFDLLPGSRW